MRSIILAVGAGRDGTTTLQKIIEEIFSRNGHNGLSHHQKDHRYLYNQFCLLKETGNKDHLDNIRKTIEKWEDGDAIVGNGYAPIMDIIHDIHKEKIKLIHLKREKLTWIDSFVQNVETFPWSHGNYSNHQNPVIFRMAAYHFGDLTRAEWDSLSLVQKASWYYDKTHDLIESSKRLFGENIQVRTEDLSNEETIERIAEFINKDWTTIEKKIHVNVSKIDYGHLDPQDRVIVGRFYRGFDYVRSAKNPSEGEKYFSDKIIECFVNRDEYVHNSISLEEFQEYLSTLEDRVNLVKHLIEKEKEDPKEGEKKDEKS